MKQIYRQNWNEWFTNDPKEFTVQGNGKELELLNWLFLPTG
jgi:hypothetical protein